MRPEKVFAIKFSSLYPLYVRKAEAKGRSKEEVDRILRWLTGYNACRGSRPASLQDPIDAGRRGIR